MFLLLLSLSASAQTLVDIATDATDPNNWNDEEASIAVNPLDPQQIAVISFSGSFWGNGKLAPVWMSSDGGKTWSKNNVLPQPNPGSGAIGDQTIAYSADGRLLLATLGTGINAPRCFFIRQSGGVFLSGAAFGDDQPIIASDNSGGAFAGRRYCAWNDLGNMPWRSTVTRTPDDGQSVQSVGVGATVINNGVNSNADARIAVAPNGHVFTVYEANPAVPVMNGFRTATFRVTRSDDGGVTWNANGGPTGVPVHAGTVQAWYAPSWGDAKNGGKTARNLGSNTSIAVNPTTGEVWVAFCNKDASNFGQIFATHSANDGVTWSAPIRVTDGTHHSSFPQIAVASNGTVGVLFVDFDNSGAQTVYRQRFARSFDIGMSWPTTLLQSFTTQSLSNGLNNFLWGDYEGLTAAGHTFYGVFTGKSIGRANVQLDPIFFRISATQASRDVYVRDWTDTPVSFDDGTEPSTHADFVTTSDVWNRHTNAAPVFNANDQPLNQSPQFGVPNFMNVRLSRNITGSTPTVTVKFYWADFPGGNYHFVGSQNVTFGLFAKTAFGVQSWTLPLSATPHISLAAEITYPFDTPQPPSVLALHPGTVISDQAIKFDNNKAQRNTAAVFIVVGLLP